LPPPLGWLDIYRGQSHIHLEEGEGKGGEVLRRPGGKGKGREGENGEERGKRERRRGKGSLGKRERGRERGREGE